MLHLDILLPWRNVRSLLVILFCCFPPCLYHYYCLYHFCEILSFSPNPPVKSHPSVSPILICCLYFHIHSSIRLFPSHLLIVFLSNCISVVQNFSLVSSQSVRFPSPTFGCPQHQSPPCSLLLRHPGFLLHLQPCIHPCHCFPSHDG